jgi:hypothetical protein
MEKYWRKFTHKSPTPRLKRKEWMDLGFGRLAAIKTIRNTSKLG